jgi:hypothetical protein
MPLGQGIGDWWEAFRDRVEVSGHGPTWEVTAGSVESALAYARDRFGEPAVLARIERDRWWPRVTLTVTTDAELAAEALAPEEVARPFVPAQARRSAPADQAEPARAKEPLPSSLEAIFAHQEELRLARQRSHGPEEHSHV